jgi:hypothetical protein
MLGSLATRLGHLLERSGEKVTGLQLRQAGWYRDLPEEETVAAFRMAQLRSIALGGGLAFAIGLVLGLATVPRIALVVLGLVVGATRQQGALQSAIARRRERMCIEI